MGFALKLRGIDKAEIAARVDRAAAILGLGPYLERYPRQLSGGQRQRVAMGRAIVRDPQVFLFDEPLSNLDAKLRVQMRAEIKELHQRLKTTTIFVTHDQIEAMTMADKIVVMNAGRIEQIGAPLELYDRPLNLFVAEFIGSPAMNLIRGVARPGGVEAAGQPAAGRERRGGRGAGGGLRHPPRAPRPGADEGLPARVRRGRADRRRDPGLPALRRAGAGGGLSRPPRPRARARRCTCGRGPTGRTCSIPRRARRLRMSERVRPGLRRFQHPRHHADGDARGHGPLRPGRALARACWRPSSAPAGA